MFLLLLIDVATVSRGYLFWSASNVIKSSHARACAINSIILERWITIIFMFTSLSIVFKVFIKLPPPPDSSSSCCCIVYYVLSML